MTSPIPATISARMGAMLARMTAQGVTEPAQVWGTRVQRDPRTNRPIARQPVLFGTLVAAVFVSSGNEQLDQEGARYTVRHELYFQPGVASSLDAQGNALLSDANYRDRWIVLPNRANEQWRIAACQSFGPYVWCRLEEGGKTDLAGNVR